MTTRDGSFIFHQQAKLTSALERIAHRDPELGQQRGNAMQALLELVGTLEKRIVSLERQLAERDGKSGVKS